MKVVVYGSRADGHAKVVADLAADESGLELVGLVDDFPENAERVVGDLRVIGTGEALETLRREGIAEGVLLGFGESKGRAELVGSVLAAGLELPPLVHPSAQVRPSSSLGAGAQILALAYVGPDARIGAGALVNTAAIVEHDAFIDDGAVLGPAATVCGRARVGSNATIGAGAILLPDVQIGEGATVGAGAVARHDVQAGSVVAGVPARPVDSPR